MSGRTGPRNPFRSVPKWTTPYHGKKNCSKKCMITYSLRNLTYNLVVLVGGPLGIATQTSTRSTYDFQE